MSNGPTCLTMAHPNEQCTRGLVGAFWMAVLLLALHTFLFLRAKRAAHGQRPVRFMDLIVTGDDNKYSLSRFQVYAWTMITAIAFGASSFAWQALANLPTNLYMLVGVNLGSAVAATAINAVKKGGAPAVPTAPPPSGAATSSSSGGPNFFNDIFFESGIVGSLDLPRTQTFVWTIITLGAWIVAFVGGFPHTELLGSTDGRPVLPDVPTGMLALLGVSQGAYLGSKAASR